jgi:2-methylisocitrate lyase-like PEP mutase family enzyme
MLDGGRTPINSFKELEELGYSRCSVPVMTTYAAAMGMQIALEQMMLEGTNKNLEGKIIPFSEFNKIIGLPEIRKLEEMFLTDETITAKYGTKEQIKKEKALGH